LRKIDAAIIGAGPAGMAAAIRLRELGVKDILVFERGSALGGILNQCIHPGFGTSYYKKDLTGPQYAARMIKEFIASGTGYRLKTSAVDLSKNKVLTVTSKEHGFEQYEARAVILATGCRERTRENLEIPGTRPAGIFKAGQAQELINIRNYKIGKNVIIQGSGDIGLIMARRLKIEGYNVIRVFERLPFLSGLIRNKVQCLDDYGIPADFYTQICEIKGKERVEGVWTENLDGGLKPVPGTRTYHECDTVLFSVGLIPEVELGKKAGILLRNNFNPAVNSKFETDVSGVFVCGNSLHIHDLADNASLEAERTAQFVHQYLSDSGNYHKDLSHHKPYRDKNTGTRFNKDFFTELKDRRICIICPKGCILDGVDFDCERGKTFYEKEAMGKKRRLATTVYCEFRGVKSRIPVISEEETDISSFKELKDRLREITKLESLDFSIDTGNTIIHFTGIKN
jgi:thioredoxin reductase/CxxC motif-containing protein